MVNRLKTLEASVSTKADAKKELMVLLQKVLTEKSQEWQQPSMTTINNMTVPFSIAIWALVAKAVIRCSKTRQASVPTSTNARQELVFLVQVLPVEAQEWQQPCMTNTKQVTVPSSKAVWALVPPPILNDNQLKKWVKSFQFIYFIFTH